MMRRTENSECGRRKAEGGRRNAEGGMRNERIRGSWARIQRSAFARAVPIALLATTCQRAQEQEAETASGRAPTVVSNARVAFPRTSPQHEWHMPGGDYSNSRYSELTEIT